MRIKDFSWSHTVGDRPSVDLCLSDVTSDELTALRNLALRRDRIKIESKEDPKPSSVRPITIADMWPTDIICGYSKRDVEVTSKMLGGFTFNRNRELKVEKVIFNKPATIVFWSDNTKTVVVCGENDTYDKEKGFYIACAKKLFGNDYKAVGRMNKALEMAVVQTKEEEK
jgi:hypothetical protein